MSDRHCHKAQQECGSERSAVPGAQRPAPHQLLSSLRGLRHRGTRRWGRAPSHPQTPWASPSAVAGSVTQWSLQSPEGKAGPTSPLPYHIYLYSIPEVTLQEVRRRSKEPGGLRGEKLVRPDTMSHEDCWPGQAQLEGDKGAGDFSSSI